MTETKDTTEKTLRGGGRKPPSLQRTVESGHVRQNFSHGRSKSGVGDNDRSSKRTNAAAAQQAGKSKDLFLSDVIPLFYCWSHGLSKTSQHTSKTYNNQSEGHCADATIENRLRGVNKINFGCSGKQRRVPTA